MGEEGDGGTGWRFDMGMLTGRRGEGGESNCWGDWRNVL